MNRTIHSAQKSNSRNGNMLWPPRLEKKLRGWLIARYPASDDKLIGFAALQIDGLVRNMVRGEAKLGVKVEKSRKKPASENVNGFAFIESGKSLLVIKQRASCVESLRRIHKAIEAEKRYQYVKAFVEASPDAIALIEQVRGSIEWDGANLIEGLAIPYPAQIAPYLESAIALASRGRLPRWRRDLAVGEIIRLLEQITGERLRQAYMVGESIRSGALPTLLDALEQFYADHLPPNLQVKFAVQKSGRATSKIVSMAGP